MMNVICSYRSSYHISCNIHEHIAPYLALQQKVGRGHWLAAPAPSTARHRPTQTRLLRVHTRPKRFTYRASEHTMTHGCLQ